MAGKISSYKSTETTVAGEPLYILEAPATDDHGKSNYNGTILKVKFKNGKGRTKYWKKAFDLYEQYNYDVILPESEYEEEVQDFEGVNQPKLKRWGIAVKAKSESNPVLPEEGDYTPDDEEPDDPDLEDYGDEDPYA